LAREKNMRREITVGIPKFVSNEQLLAGAGTAGGILFGDFMASVVTTASNLTGAAGLLGSIAVKGLLGFGLYRLSSGATGMARPLGFFASVGCVASIVIDLVRFAWPGSAKAGARVGARLRGAVTRAPVKGSLGVTVTPSGATSASVPSEVAVSAPSQSEQIVL